MAKIKRTTKKYLIRVIVLLSVFVIALGGYFAWSMINTEKEFTVYTSMDEPTLPVVYAVSGGQELNVMHGYLQEMGNEAASDSITILPENRKLDLRIAEYDNMVAGVSYEIRSLDLSHFIEKTEVSELRRENGSAYLTLPIQNLIEKDTQYLLKIMLDTGEHNINYYTRIIWTDDNYVNQMAQMAKDFTRKTFNYDEARELTAYLETNPEADNSNFGEVGIDSSFSQLTWGNTGMRLTTDLDVTFKQYNGIMGAIEVRYMTERTNELERAERYMVVDEYTMRMGTERIYLMNFDRKVNQIFEGNKHLFTGKQILLGITSDAMLQTEKSPNGQYIAFKTNKELWSYDQENKRAVNIFSFRSGVDDGVRANYQQHDIKILSVEDTGDIDFVVYGYINRDRHEGMNGIVYYSYNNENDTINERFFIPLAKSYEKISLELSELCKKGSNDMFYLKQNNAISAIDLNSLEMLDIATGLTDGSYAVSRDQTKVAWQDGSLYGAVRIKLMDVMTGATATIDAENGDCLRVIGFSNQDLIYGSARPGDAWRLNNRMKGMQMYRLEIIAGDLSLQKEYQKDGIYVENVRIEENRIHLSQYRKDENGAYQYLGEDTIVCKEPGEPLLKNISSYQTNDRKKVYVVLLDQEIKTTRNLKVSVPRKISYENAGSIELKKPSRTESGVQFFAYANGRLLGSSRSLQQAVSLCYGERGWVTDQNGMLMYNRTDRESLKTISEPNRIMSPLQQYLQTFTENRIYEEEGCALLSVQGLALDQVLYYVYQGYPVAAFLNETSYYLIYGYDNFNIRIYDPFAEEDAEKTLIMGREDAEAFFAALQNDFVCAVAYRN